MTQSECVNYLFMLVEIFSKHMTINQQIRLNIQIRSLMCNYNAIPRRDNFSHHVIKFYIIFKLKFHESHLWTSHNIQKTHD